MLGHTSGAAAAGMVCRVGTAARAETTGLVQRASGYSPAAAVEMEAGEQTAVQTSVRPALQAAPPLVLQPLAQPVAQPVAVPVA